MKTKLLTILFLFLSHVSFAQEVWVPRGLTNGGSILGDLSLVGTTTDLFVGGDTLLAGGNSSLTIASIGSDFEVSGDTYSGFPLTIYWVSNKSFVNPFTNELGGAPTRISQFHIAGALNQFSYFSSDNTAPYKLQAFIGTTTPTTAPISISVSKLGAAGATAVMAATEKTIQLGASNGAFLLFGDGSIDVSSSAKISFNSSLAYPTDSNAWLGTTNNGHDITLNTETNGLLVAQVAGTRAASMSSVGIFTFAPPAQSSGTTSTFLVTGGAHTAQTASANVKDVIFDFSATLQHATGAVAAQTTFDILSRTYGSVGSSTYSSVGTLAVPAPNAGTNSIFSDVWAVKLGGNVNIGASQASQMYEALSIPPHTVTITGSTQNTRTDSAFSGARMGSISITDASAVTIDRAATLSLDSPVGAGSVTLTDPLALYANGNILTTGTFKSSNTGSIGWSVVTGANTACNTTCNNACVFGQDTAALTYAIVDCADATADRCVCAGAN